MGTRRLCPANARPTSPRRRRIRGAARRQAEGLRWVPTAAGARRRQRVRRAVRTPSQRLALEPCGSRPRGRAPCHLRLAPAPAAVSAQQHALADRATDEAESAVRRWRRRPVLELQARNGRWLMLGDWHGFWSGRVRTGVWTRFAFDVSYSQDPALGSIRIYADLNGDGDALDKGEKSRVYHRATLRRETTGGWSGTASSPAPRSRHISVLASTTTRSTAASAIAARSGWTT